MALVNKNFSDIITFTRASTATFFNSAGVLTSAATNAPRFDYNPSTLAAQGLLIEESRTNLLTYSDQLNDVIWVKTDVTVTANNTTSPDGTVNADLLTEGTAGTAFTVNSTLATVSSGATISASLFVKRSATIQWLRFRASNTAVTNGGNVWFDIQNGVKGNETNLGSGTNTSGTITLLPNGWYRISVTTTLVAGDVSALGGVCSASANGSTTRVNNSAYWAWGAQLEAGAFPTSYIPTTTTALTRAADVASVNTLSPWFNASASTIYAEVAVPQLGRAARPWTVDDGSMSNIVDATISVANGFAVEAIAGGVYGGFAAATGLITANTTQKTAAVFTTSGNELACLNAGTVGSNAITLPSVSLTRLLLGRQDNGVVLCGWLRRLTYYPRAFSAAELQAITT
ncbi:MAG: hypothetical protein ACK528_04455 [Alphaproteobacteria bacterium]|jgi:hypothetical protein